MILHMGTNIQRDSSDKTSDTYSNQAPQQGCWSRGTLLLGARTHTFTSTSTLLPRLLRCVCLCPASESGVYMRIALRADNAQIGWLTSRGVAAGAGHVSRGPRHFRTLRLVGR